MSLRICIIGKYPPIQGGVSSDTYWLARALGERGHEVHVVTNAWEVEDEYKERIENCGAEEYEPRNVYVHSTDPSASANPWHIPYSKAYAQKLASLAIETIERYDLKVIDSQYLVPYVASGFVAKIITERPQIVRHAGSDMRRLLPSPYLNTLFRCIFERADAIVAYPQTKQTFLDLGIPEAKVFVSEEVHVDCSAFNPQVEPIDLAAYTDRGVEDLPVIAFIGKIPYFWQTQGLDKLAEACKLLDEDYLLLFVANGGGLDKFKAVIKGRGLEGKSLFLDFMAPWKIPSVIKRSTCVVLPRHGSTNMGVSAVAREVMAVGRCLILSKELHENAYRDLLCHGESVLVVDPTNIEEFGQTLKNVISNPPEANRIGQRACEAAQSLESFDTYVESIEDLYVRVSTDAGLFS